MCPGDILTFTCEGSQFGKILTWTIQTAERRVSTGFLISSFSDGRVLSFEDPVFEGLAATASVTSGILTALLNLTTTTSLNGTQIQCALNELSNTAREVSKECSQFVVL